MIEEHSFQVESVPLSRHLWKSDKSETICILLIHKTDTGICGQVFQRYLWEEIPDMQLGLCRSLVLDRDDLPRFHRSNK